MSKTRFNLGNPMSQSKDVQRFMELFSHYLQQDQIDIINYFNDKIIGFHMESHDISSPTGMNVHDHKATFAFYNAGATGEITIMF